MTWSGSSLSVCLVLCVHWCIHHIILYICTTLHPLNFVFTCYSSTLFLFSYFILFITFIKINDLWINYIIISLMKCDEVHMVFYTHDYHINSIPNIYINHYIDHNCLFWFGSIVQSVLHSVNFWLITIICHFYTCIRTINRSVDIYLSI